MESYDNSFSYTNTEQCSASRLVLNIQKDDEELKFPMTTLNGERWSFDWCVEQLSKAYTYYYSVVREGVVLKTEWLLVKHRLDTDTRTEGSGISRSMITGR